MRNKDIKNLFTGSDNLIMVDNFYELVKRFSNQLN